jgi:hypothetical protein
VIKYWYLLESFDETETGDVFDICMFFFDLARAF